MQAVMYIFETSNLFIDKKVLGRMKLHVCKSGKNHKQIFFSLTKLIYTHASGHVNF